MTHQNDDAVIYDESGFPLGSVPAPKSQHGTPPSGGSSGRPPLPTGWTRPAPGTRNTPDDVLLVTSVLDWKVCTPEVFAQAVHFYATAKADAHGHGGINSTMKDARNGDLVTIYYSPIRPSPEARSITSPVLMTILRDGGKVLCFKSTKYGLAGTD